MEDICLRVSASMRRLATDIEKRKVPLSRLGKDCVFRDSGAPCCPLGHALAMTPGARKRLIKFGPYKGASFDGQPGPRWWDNDETLSKATGRSWSPQLQTLLTRLETENAVLIGDERRKSVVSLLRIIASAINNEVLNTSPGA